MYPNVPFFPNSNSFGVFSHSKGFGAELLSDSLQFSGALPSWAANRFRGRFRQGSTKVSPRFHQCSKFCGVSGAGQIHLGLPKVSTEGSKKVPPRFGQGSTFVSQMAVPSEKVFWRVPPTLLYICLPVLFWGQSCMSC